MSELPAVIAAYFACINAEDWDGLAAVFGPDPEIRPVGSPPRRGRDAVLAYYPWILEGFGPHLEEVVRPLVAPEAVAVELLFTGETRTGLPVRFEAVDVFDLDEAGLIRRVRMCYDTADVNRQVRGRP